ncbi:EpsG family protein [Acinetobacter sp. ANC 3832]|uniref:EpsG family protein n=1 Tax=Acinetobacter sp. ANC 3832 TaxID=1977874 RepID=UPI000A35B9D9|nr:EpsG family protein [Acinetobacter sp. ANC 3832]OTG90617.1 hypothetical protein B9T35_14905 [Acinetobacter sp. ANC 3832]
MKKDVIEMRESDKIFNLILGIFFATVSVVLVLFSSLKPLGFDKDSYSYLFDMRNIQFSEISREYSFIIVSKFINNYLDGDIFYLFLFYATLSISIKLYCIYRFSVNKLLSLFIYLLLFYFIQDVTQIRVGVSTAFLLLAYAFFCMGNYKKYLMMSLFSIFFHYQAVLIFSIFVFNKIKLKYCFIIMMVSFVFSIFFSGLLKILLLTFFSKIGFGFIASKIEAYYDSSEFGAVAKFGAFQLFYMIILFIYLYLYSRFKNQFTNIDIINLKIMMLNLSLYFVLSFNSVFSLRVFEYFSTLLIFIIPMVLRFFYPKSIGVLIVLFICSYYYYSAILSNLNFELYFG